MSTPVPIAPARNPASAPTPSPKPTKTGAIAANSPGVVELAQRVARADVHDAAVFGTLLARHDAGHLAELAAHLEHDRACGAGDGVDREPGEQEHGRAADDDAHQGERVDDLVA